MGINPKKPSICRYFNSKITKAESHDSAFSIITKRNVKLLEPRIDYIIIN